MGWQSALQLREAERELGPRLGSEAWIPDSLLWCSVIVLLVNYLGLLLLRTCFQKLVNHMVSGKLLLCLHPLVITFVLNIISND